MDLGEDKVKLPKTDINSKVDLRSQFLELIMQQDEKVKQQDEKSRQQGEMIAKLKESMIQQGLDIDQLRHDVDKLTQELQEIRVTLDRAINLCFGHDEESKSRRDRIKELENDLSRAEYFATILTQIENLVIVAKAVNSKVIEWNAELPWSVSATSHVASLVTLAPVPGSDVLARGIKVSISFLFKAQQITYFQDLATFTSNAALRDQQHWNALVVELALAWSDNNAEEVQELPKWDDPKFREFREELFRTWGHFCLSVQEGQNSIYDGICHACNKLIKEVGLQSASDDTGGIRVIKKKGLNCRKRKYTRK